MASKFRNLGIGIGVTTGTVIGFGSSAACDFATAMVCSPANPSIVAGFAAAGGAIGGAVGGTAGAIYDYVFGNKDGSRDANYVTPNQDPDRFVRGPRGTGVKVIRKTDHIGIETVQAEMLMVEISGSGGQIRTIGRINGIERVYLLTEQ